MELSSTTIWLEAEQGSLARSIGWTDETTDFHVVIVAAAAA